MKDHNIPLDNVNIVFIFFNDHQVSGILIALYNSKSIISLYLSSVHKYSSQYANRYTYPRCNKFYFNKFNLHFLTTRSSDMADIQIHYHKHNLRFAKGIFEDEKQLWMFFENVGVGTIPIISVIMKEL